MTLYNQVYASLSQKIFSGRYPHLSEMPGMEELMREYDVSMPTLRQALSLLSADGLISTRQGRRAIVTYSGAVSLDSGEYMHYLAARRSSLTDAHRLYAAAIPSLMTYVALVTTPADINELQAIMDGLKPTDNISVKIQAFIQFICRAAACLKNTMLSGLLKEITEYTLLPTLMCPEQNEYSKYIDMLVYGHLEMLMRSIRNRDIDWLISDQKTESKCVAHEFERYINDIAAQVPNVRDELRPFRWVCSPASHFIYSSIAEDMVRKIATSIFRGGDLLPSESAIRSTYNVSTVTARRAIKLLVHMGLAYTEQGKGCYVITSGRTEIAQELEREYYERAQTFAEVIQFNSIFFPVLMLETLADQSSESVRNIVNRISEHITGRTEDYPMALMVMSDCFIDICASRIGRDIYSHIVAVMSRQLAFCSYYCKIHPKYVEHILQLMKRMCDALLRRDDVLACRLLYDQFTDILKNVMMDCKNRGITVVLRAPELQAKV